MIQQPVDALQKLRGDAWHWDPVAVEVGDNLLSGITGSALEIVAVFSPATATEFGFQVRSHGTHRTTVGYNRASSTLFVDRTDSGHASFHPSFPGRQEVGLSVVDGAIKLHLFVDWSSVKVFGNDGAAVITDSHFSRCGR